MNQLRNRCLAAEHSSADFHRVAVSDGASPCVVFVVVAKLACAKEAATCSPLMPALTESVACRPRGL